nr:MAG TPA: hypothetical protein [Inoviridae sp.]
MLQDGRNKSKKNLKQVHKLLDYQNHIFYLHQIRK